MTDTEQAREHLAKRCKTCGGTGAQVLLKSWFKSDGLRKGRCGICAGTGESSYQPAPDVARLQQHHRESFPIHPDL